MIPECWLKPVIAAAEQRLASTYLRYRRLVLSYTLAVAVPFLVLFLVLFLRTLLLRNLGPPGVLITSSFVIPALLASAVGGLGPGLVATTVSLAVEDYFVLAPIGSLVIASPVDWLRAGMMVTLSIFISCSNEALQRARRRAVQIAERLSQSEERLRATFEKAAIGIVEADAEDRLIAVNDRACQIFGYGREELLGVWVHDLTVPEDRPRSDELNRQLHLGRFDRIRHEKRYLRRDGTTIWCHLTAAAILDSQGRYVRSVGTIEDISERKHADEALRDSEARFRSLFELSPYGIGQVDPQTGRLLLVNEQFCHITGHTREELLSFSVRDLTHPDDRVADWEKFHRLTRGEVPEYENEKRYVRKDGKAIWVHVAARGIRDGEGRVVGAMGIVQDITDRRLAEQALISTEKLASVGRMAATIAHEINNPLAAAMNTLFLAKSAEGLPELARQYLDIADGELQLTSHISRQALGFYRESAKPAPTSVDALLNSVTDLLRSKIKAKHVAIERRWEEDLEVNAVAGELRQVFSNLVANSLDAIEEGGTIRLRFSRIPTSRNSDGYVRVKVADDGKGIPVSALPHIFEPFFTTKDAIGTGLGLWVSKQIVDKHGGSIHVHSRTSGPHRGTVFSVLLPLGAMVDGARPQRSLTASDARG